MESERLKLRKFVVEDAEAVYLLAKDEEVGLHAGWPPHTSVENTKDILTKILIKEDQFAIVEKKSGKVIGAVGIALDPKRSNDEVKMLGYWVGKDYWGQGYATEAANVVLKNAFETLNLQLVSCYHYAYNLKSENVIKKLGFQYEGYLRQGTKRYDGMILDDVVYSMTREEYIRR